jgi:hypothetical protein
MILRHPVPLASHASFSIPIASSVVTVMGQDAPLADPAAKLRLHQSLGTVAVDLESHVAARIATARNLSFAACRVILDPASLRVACRQPHRSPLW